MDNDFKQYLVILILMILLYYQILVLFNGYFIFKH